MANVKDLEPYAANLEGLIAVLEDIVSEKQCLLSYHLR